MSAFLKTDNLFGPMDYEREGQLRHKARRTKKKARHAVYRAGRGYSMMYMPGPSYGQYPAPAPEDLVQTARVVEATTQPTSESTFEDEGEFVNSLTAPELWNGLPVLETTDIRLPPVNCQIHIRNG